MHLLNKLKYILLQIYHRKFSFFLSVLTITIALVILNYIMFQGIDAYYQVIKVTQIMKQKELVYNVQFDDKSYDLLDNKKLSKFFKEIQSIKGLTNCGKYFTYSLVFNELQNVQKIPNNYGEYTVQNILYIDQSLLNLIDLETIENEKLETIMNDKADIPVVIGYNYRTVLSVGDILTNKYLDRNYKVVGIMKKGCEWISNGLLYSNPSTMILDNFMVALSDNELLEKNLDINFSYMDNIYLKLENKSKLQNVKNEITSLSEYYNIPITLVSIDDKIQYYKSENAETYKMAFGFMFVGIIITTLSVCMASNITVMLRKKEYAIMNVNGFYVSDIIKMLLFENAMKIIIPLVIAYNLVSAIIINENYYTLQRAMEIQHIVLGIMICYCVILLMVCTIFPMIILHKKNPANVLGGRYND